MAFKKLKYNKQKYAFDNLVKSIFQVKSLENLHIERKDLLPTEDLNFGNESKTQFHELFYFNLNNTDLGINLRRLYASFIENEIYPIFQRDILYQTFPTVRFHLPESKAIHYWHCDSDDNHRHPFYEINFQLSLTDSYDTQSTWIESVPGLGDYSPMEMKLGEYYVFDGNRCKHGNKVNTSGKTRVSLDFRILPKESYVENKKSKGSATKGKKFVIGEYYEYFKK